MMVRQPQPSSVPLALKRRGQACLRRSNYPDRPRIGGRAGVGENRTGVEQAEVKLHRTVGF
jgi:hypothetical protein